MGANFSQHKFDKNIDISTQKWVDNSQFKFNDLLDEISQRIPKMELLMNRKDSKTFNVEQSSAINDKLIEEMIHQLRSYDKICQFKFLNLPFSILQQKLNPQNKNQFQKELTHVFQNQKCHSAHLKAVLNLILLKKNKKFESWTKDIEITRFMNPKSALMVWILTAYWDPKK